MTAEAKELFLADRVRALVPALPLLLMTGYTEEAITRAGLTPGKDAALDIDTAAMRGGDPGRHVGGDAGAQHKVVVIGRLIERGSSGALIQVPVRRQP